MEEKIYNVYIDESGDEGIRRGTKWFILTAIIVSKEYDLTLSNKIVEIKNKLGLDRKSQLHWNKLLNYDKKIKIIYDLVSENFKIIHIAINTDEIIKLGSKEIYPYFMSYLIERVTYFVNSQNAKCNIFISTRQENKKEKNQYLINELTSKSRYHYINIDCINKIKFIDNREKNLLQLADVCCSSFAQAIKFNTIKEWEYVIKLKANLYSYKEKILNYGIKFYPPLNRWYDIFPYLSYILI